MSLHEVFPFSLSQHGIDKMFLALILDETAKLFPFVS
jgi:hypothetical protein